MRHKKWVALVGLSGLGFLAAGAAVRAIEVQESGLATLVDIVISRSGSYLGLENATTQSLRKVARAGVPLGVTAFGELRSALSAAQSQPSAPTESDRVQAAALGIVDAKDKIINMLQESLSPEDRMNLITKVANQIEQRTGLLPEDGENLASIVRKSHLRKISRLLNWSPDRASALQETMEPMIAERGELRRARHALIGRMKAASSTEAPDLMAAWDHLNSEASQITRRQIEATARTFTPAEKQTLARSAHERLERVMGFFALVGAHKPIGG